MDHCSFAHCAWYRWKNLGCEYDKNHPEKPLLDVTVGMKGNKMSEFIKQNLEKSSILLKGGKYRGYEGDGTSEQYILYKRTKERET